MWDVMRNTDKSCELLFVRRFAAISGQHMHRQLQSHAPNRLSMLKKYGYYLVCRGRNRGVLEWRGKQGGNPNRISRLSHFSLAVFLQLFQHPGQPLGGVELKAAVFVVRRDDLAQKPGKHRLGADLDKDPHLLGQVSFDTAVDSAILQTQGSYPASPTHRSPLDRTPATSRVA